MRVVVTGGAGFVGSNLIEALLKSHEVTVIDDLSTGRRENVHRFIDDLDFIQGSITDMDLLRDAFEGVDTDRHMSSNRVSGKILIDSRGEIRCVLESSTKARGNVRKSVRVTSCNWLYEIL